LCAPRLCITISFMHAARRISSIILLITFTLNSTYLGLLADRFFNSGSRSNTASCPVHSLDCRCPEVCNVSIKPRAKSGCHSSPDSTRNGQPFSSSSSPSCFLKAGCGGRDDAGSPVSSPKDFLPQLPGKLAFELIVFFPVRSFHSDLLHGYSPQLFHPPRNV
jgi:hypothetical protein